MIASKNVPESIAALNSPYLATCSDLVCGVAVDVFLAAQENDAISRQWLTRLS